MLGVKLEGMWTLALTLAALAPSGDAPVALVFDPPPGSAVTRTIEGALDIELDELSLRGADGSTVDVRAFVGLDARVTVGGRLTTNDVYVESSGGAPLVLEREYDLIDTRWALGRRWTSYRVLHPLTYRTVVFERSVDARYRARWSRDRRGDRDVLDALAWDLDGLALLPAEPVALGEGWTVPVEDLADVVLLGGRLHRPTGPWEELGLDSLECSLTRELAGRFDGRAHCELVRIAERSATLRFAFTHDLDADLERLEVDAGAADGAFEGSFRLSVEAYGRLEWDLVERRAAALALRLVFELEGTVRARRGFPVLEVELSGGWEQEMRADVAGHGRAHGTR